MDKIRGSRPTSLIRPALVALAYVAGFLVLDFATEGVTGSTTVSLWFPPAGLTLALLIVFGWRYGVVVAAAFLLHLVLFREGAGYPPWLLVAMPILYAAIYGGAAAFLLRGVGMDRRLARMRDVGWFVGIACLLAPLVVAAVTVAGFILGGYTPADAFWGEMLGFWAGDATGIGVLTPILLVAARRFGPTGAASTRPPGDGASTGIVPEGATGFGLPSRRELPEAGAQLLALALALAAAYGAARGASLDYAYLAFAPVVWIALRGGFERTALALLVANLGVVALVGLDAGGGDPVLLQFGLMALTLVGILLGALTTEQRRAERSLERSEQRYRAMVENQSEMICRYAPDTTITFANDAYCRYFGKGREELLGTSFLALVPPEDWETTRRHVERVVEEGVEETYEHRVVAADGELRWQQWTDRAINDDEGEVAEIQCVGRDTTDRREAEEALARERNLLRTVIDSADDAIFVKNTDHRFRLNNRAHAGWLGAEDPHDLLGKTNADYWGDEKSAPHHADDRRVMDTGERIIGREEWMHHAGSGEERWISTTKVPLMGPGDEVEGLVAVSRDITDKRRAEEALRESERRLSEAQKIAGLGSWEWDVRGGRVLWSEEQHRIHGLRPGEFRGTVEAHFEFVHPEDREIVRQSLEQTLGSPGSVELESRITRPDGGVRVVHTRRRTVRDERGEPVKVVGTTQDITGRKQAEKRLREAEERYRTLVEKIPAAIYMQELGEPSRTTYIGPQMKAMQGYSPEEITGDPEHWTRTLHPDDRQRVLAEDRRTNETGEPFSMEYRQRARDGRVLWVRDEAVIVHEGEGGRSYWLGVLTDVTERKRAEEALRQSEENQRRRARELSLLHDVRSALSGELDPQGVCRAVVEAVAGAYGYVLVSAYLIEEQGQRLSLQHQVGYRAELRHIPVDRGVMWRTVRSREPALLEDAHSDPDFLDAVQGIVSEVCVPLLDGDETIGTLNVESTQDRSLDGEDLRLLTEVGQHAGAALGRARLHERLTESEKRFRTAFEDASTGAALVSLDNRYLRVNSALCELFGYTEEEILAMRSFDLTHPEDLAKSRRRGRSMLAEGGPGSVSLEKRYLRRDGSVVWTISDVALVYDPEGRPSHFISQFQDITARKNAEESLKASEALLKTVTGEAPVILFALDRDGVLTFERGAALEALGVTPGQSVGRSVFEAYPDLPGVLENVRRALNGEEVAATVELQGFAFDTRYTPMRGEGGEVDGVIGVATDITERRALEKRLTNQALHDPLTGLPNRRLLSERLRHALEHRQRSVALLFLDLDGFKDVNDTLGHDAGDTLLVEVARRLREAVRPSDTLARLGGDEFTVLLKEADAGRAEGVARRISAALEEPFTVGGREFGVRASVGIALGADARAQGTRWRKDASTLLLEADMAMYRAKRQNKGSYALHHPEASSESRKRFELRAGLTGALERGEFTLRYQPIISMTGGEVAGFETLLRWEHPERGVLAPAEFLSVAEALGLALPLSRLALQGAGRFGAGLPASHRTAPGPASLPWISVNLSPHLLGQPGLSRVVEATLAETGLDPGRLVLEITEEATVNDGEEVEATLRALKAYGVRLAVDDFGTGYSSLSHLERLPADFLKLDRTFIAGLAGNTRKASMIRGVSELAHALGMRVIAEGVEDRDQLEALRGCGCDLAQRYLSAAPLATEEASALLASGMGARHRPYLGGPGRSPEG